MEIRCAVMNEGNKKKIVAKRPYSAPKLVEYGSVSKLTEAKSNGSSDIGSTTKHNV
jgi:hypothetical protein